MTFDFSVLDTAGVSQVQFGRLVGVSRITVNCWVRGRHAPGKQHTRRITAVLDMLKEAVERNVLPTTRDSRNSATQRVLDTMATAHLKG